MDKVLFRGLQPGDEAYIAANLCQGERATCAGTGTAPEEVTANAIMLSSVVRVVTDVNGTPLALYGIIPLPSLNWGGLWFLATDEFFKYPRVMLVEGRKFVNEMLQRYDQLIDVVDTRHTGTLSWLRHLGFTPVETQRYKDVEMRLFARGR